MLSYTWPLYFLHSTPEINSDGAFLVLGLKSGGRREYGLVMWDAILLGLLIILTLFRHLLKFEFMMECFKAKLKDSYLPCEASALFLQVMCGISQTFQIC